MPDKHLELHDFFYKQHQAKFWEKLSKHRRMKFLCEEKNTENPNCLYFVQAEIE